MPGLTGPSRSLVINASDSEDEDLIDVRTSHNSLICCSLLSFHEALSEYENRAAELVNERWLWLSGILLMTVAVVIAALSFAQTVIIPLSTPQDPSIIFDNTNGYGVGYLVSLLCFLSGCLCIRITRFRSQSTVYSYWRVQLLSLTWSLFAIVILMYCYSKHKSDRTNSTARLLHAINAAVTLLATFLQLLVAVCSVSRAWQCYCVLCRDHSHDRLVNEPSNENMNRII